MSKSVNIFVLGLKLCIYHSDDRMGHSTKWLAESDHSSLPSLSCHPGQCHFNQSLLEGTVTK